MITFRHKGSFKNTERFFTKSKQLNILRILKKYGPEGVSALAKATPKDTGLTAESWNYVCDVSRSNYSIKWYNTNENNGIVIALIIQYGHGTRNGGYVYPIDYVNPAMKPIFDKISDDIWREVQSL